MLEILKSLLFGIVEGITEWLPVSSTGHMILFDEFVQLNMSAAFKEMYLVVIQLGAYYYSGIRYGRFRVGQSTMEAIRYFRDGSRKISLLCG